jgi:hypothetical protein
MNFLNHGYHKVPLQGQIRPQPTAWSEIKEMWDAEVDRKGGVANVLMMRNEDGEIQYLAFCLFIGTPIFSIILLYSIIRGAC